MTKYNFCLLIFCSISLLLTVVSGCNLFFGTHIPVIPFAMIWLIVVGAFMLGITNVYHKAIIEFYHLPVGFRNKNWIDENDYANEQVRKFIHELQNTLLIQ